MKQFLVFFLLIVSNTIGAQQDRLISYLTEEFQLIHTEESFQIEAKLVKCNLNGADFTLDMVFLRIENRSNQELKLDMGLNIVYDTDCVNCDSSSPEYLKSVVLQPNSTMVGSCDEMMEGLSYTIRANHGLDHRVFKGIRISTLNQN